MPLLSRDEVERRLRDLPGWRLDDKAIVKQFTFAGFPEAVAFVARLAPGAEAADHHPDVTITYRRVTLSYSTHSEGGITAKDFDGAHAAEACSRLD
jgi:4a-hydroxytetrahydrobiopterin dehydratase